FLALAATAAMRHPLPIRSVRSSPPETNEALAGETARTCAAGHRTCPPYAAPSAQQLGGEERYGKRRLPYLRERDPLVGAMGLPGAARAEGHGLEPGAADQLGHVARVREP